MPSKSQKQQKLFGLALSVKRGNTPRKDVSNEVLKIVDSMSEDKIKDYAETKHKDVPNKVETIEYIRNVVREMIQEKMNEAKIPKPIHGLINHMVNNKIHQKTVKIKDKKGHDRFMKDVKPAIKANLLRIDHDGKEMKITLGSEAQKMIESSINESEEISQSDLSPSEQKTITSISKILDVGRYPTSYYKSIHGLVVEFENSKQMGEYRFDRIELKKLSGLPIRWIESDKRTVSIGL